MRRLRSDSFQWLAGLFCSLLGTIMLVHPNQSQLIQPQSNASLYFIVGTSLVVVGPMLLLVMVLRLSHMLQAFFNVLGALLLLMITATLIAAGGWISGMNIALLALAMIISPFLPSWTDSSIPLKSQPSSGDLISLIAGISSMLVGAFLILPGDLSTLHYRLPEAGSYVYSVLFFTGGLVLVALTLPVSHSRPRAASVYRIISALMALVYFSFPLFAGYPQSLWFASIYYMAVGLALAVFPRLFSPDSRFKMDTLYVRLAVIFAVGVSIPMILISTLVTHLEVISRAFQLPSGIITRQDIILGALLLILAMTILVGLRLAHAFVAPLHRLAAAANALADAQPDVTLPVDSRVEEVRRLAQAFTTLRDRLAERTKATHQAEQALLQHQAMLEERVAERTHALEIANRRLEALLRALPVSVIITDESGNVIRQNDIIGAGMGIDTSSFKTLEDFSALDARWADTGLPVRSHEWGLARAVLQGDTVWNDVMDLYLPEGGMRTVVHSAAPIVMDGERIIGAVAVGQDISRQRELERISRESARQAHQTAVQIEAIFNALSDSVIVYNAQGIITQANSQAIALYGFDPIRMAREQVINQLELTDENGQRVTELTMPSSLALRGESQVHQRFALTNARGRSYKVLASSAPVYVGKDLIGTVSVWRDVTERERLLDENRRQNDLLKTLIAQAPAAIAFLEGADFRYTLYNPAYERIARDKGSLMGRPVAEIWPEVSDVIIPMMENVMHTGETFSATDQRFLIARENGLEEDFFTFNFTPIIGQNGKTEGLMILASETTEYVRTNQAVYKEQSRFRGLVESITDLVCTLDENQCFTGLYGRSMEWFNLSQADVVGKSIREVLGDQAEPHLQAFEQVRAGSNIMYEWSIKLPSEVAHFQISLSPLWNDLGAVSGAVAVVRDITEMKKARLELEKYASQLKRSNLELEQFAFIASHDLQEPLRKIRAFGERVVERMQDRISEEEQDYLNRMVGATQRMQRMIEDLLTFSRVTTKGKPFEQVDLNQVAEEVLSDLEVRVERTGGTVNVGSLPSLIADPIQMHQLLQNLIGNALKYHRAGVTPQVGVEAEVINRNGSGNDGFMRLKVTDNGIGFDEDLADRIFQPFERLHGRSEYEGTGMGLAICRKIVERHRGTITAHSKMGEGSTFIIELPMYQPDHDKSEE